MVRMQDRVVENHERKLQIEFRIRGESLRVKSADRLPEKLKWIPPNLCNTERGLKKYEWLLDEYFTEINSRSPFVHQIENQYILPISWETDGHPFKREQAQWIPQDWMLNLHNSDMTAEEFVVYEINSPAHFDEMLQELESHNVLSFDVEETSCYAGSIVSLIQICVEQPNVVYVINALSMKKYLTKLNSITTNPAKLKLFHGGQNDLRHLQRCGNVYFNGVLDTQVLYEFSGISTNKNAIGLADLILRVCKFSLEKRHTHDDWTAWPLKAEMLQYAVLDVCFLRACFCWLLRTIVSASARNDDLVVLRDVCGRVAMKVSDCTFVKRIISPSHLNQRDRKRFKLLSEPGSEVYREIFYWRETLALYHNLCPTELTSNSNMLDFVFERHTLLTFDNLVRRFHCNCSFGQRTHRRMGNILTEIELQHLFDILKGGSSPRFYNRYIEYCEELQNPCISYVFLGKSLFLQSPEVEGFCQKIVPNVESNSEIGITQDLSTSTLPSQKPETGPSPETECTWRSIEEGRASRNPTEQHGDDHLINSATENNGVTEGKKNSWSCETCDVVCKTMYDIKRHLATKKHKNFVSKSKDIHDEQNINKKGSGNNLYCSTCNCQFATLYDLNRHNRTRKHLVFLNKSTLCTSTASALKIPIATGKRRSERRGKVLDKDEQGGVTSTTVLEKMAPVEEFQCHACGTSYKRPLGLKRHESTKKHRLHSADKETDRPVSPQTGFSAKVVAQPDNNGHPVVEKVPAVADASHASIKRSNDSDNDGIRTSKLPRLDSGAPNEKQVEPSSFNPSIPVNQVLEIPQIISAKRHETNENQPIFTTNLIYPHVGSCLVNVLNVSHNGVGEAFFPESPWKIVGRCKTEELWNYFSKMSGMEFAIYRLGGSDSDEKLLEFHSELISRDRVGVLGGVQPLKNVFIIPFLAGKSISKTFAMIVPRHVMDILEQLQNCLLAVFVKGRRNPPNNFLL